MNEYTRAADAFAAANGVKLEILGYEYKKYFPKDKEERYVFKCRLSRKRKQYTFNFGQSIMKGGEEPTMYDVLACLTKYDPGTFYNFCNDYGYNEKSRIVKKIYIGVAREYVAVKRLFGDIMNSLIEIQ